MDSYIFIPGRIPELSLAELLAVFSREGMEFRLTHASSPVVVEGLALSDADQLLRTLGGAIKIAKVEEEVRKVDAKVLADILCRNARDEKKWFGISVYTLASGEDGGLNRPRVHALGLAVKQELGARGVSSRFVTSHEPELSAVTVRRNRLLTRGAELLLIPKKDRVLIGHTLAVQDVDAYTARDVGRPVRDLRQGTLPPKLAQILINLARVPAGGTILDPFCGSGTVLQEAWRLNRFTVIGSDISKKAIRDSRKNLDWLRQRESSHTKEVKLFESDARAISRHVPSSSVDAIVTEPYLGPSNIRTVNDARAGIRTLTQLYREAMSSFRAVLKVGGTAVIIFPVFRVASTEMHIAPVSMFEQLGFRTVPLIPKDTAVQFNLKISDRDSITYVRPDQRVAREIFVFEKI